MRRLSLAEVEESRWERGDSALLFITDQCPVGCRHCSVDSRPDSPRITDFELFEQVVAGLAAAPLRIVGISGGEPFVERRALPYAVRELRRAGKDVVVYTSGFWARSPRPAPWIEEMLDQCGCVFLSTDAFHQAGMGEQRFCNAARAITALGVPVVVQVLDLEAEVERAEGLLESALGPDWAAAVEMNKVPLLPYGRAGEIYSISHRRPVESYGPCRVARAPVIRYDGVVSACCNETVLMGGGPAWFRRRAQTSRELVDAVDYYRESSMLQVIGREGVGRLAAHPLAGDLGTREATGICGACWSLVSRITKGETRQGAKVPDENTATESAARPLEAV